MVTVAFFGLGQMGQGMVLRLLESGYHLGVYSRTREKALVVGSVTPMVKLCAEVEPSVEVAVTSMAWLVAVS